MWVVWIVSALSIGLVAVGVLLLRDDWRTAQRGWKLLAASGIPLALGGLLFILRFWEPLPGPFRANDLYPLGPYLNTWAVSFGFMWMAFGLAFYAFALRAPAAGKTWLILFATWVLAWIPHGIIGIGFAVAGENAESVQLYQVKRPRLRSAKYWNGIQRRSRSYIDTILYHTTNTPTAPPGTQNARASKIDSRKRTDYCMIQMTWVN